MASEKTKFTEKNNIEVYNQTTKPKKPKRRDKSDLGPDFVAPDGGWGWVVCIAAGFSNFSTFPPLQQYGFIYRERMKSLGFDAKETTTIVNIVMAISSLVGIVNGAMFRRFTFRQVALVGSILVFIGIFSSAFCTTFVQYVICFSCIYGIGLGLSLAATSLAVNTYFKTKRRRATGFTWTITGLGPIIFPLFSTFALNYYGLQGSIILYSAITLNAILCSITLQPVMWHVKPKPKNIEEENKSGVEDTINSEENLNVDEKHVEEEYLCKYCQYQRQGRRSIFSSQYLFNDDDPETPGYEITEPAPLMLARANDGWFGSRVSLASDLGSHARFRHKAKRQLSIKSQEGLERTGMEHTHDENGHAGFSKPNYFNREHEELEQLERCASKGSINAKTGVHEWRCTCAEEKALMQKISDKDLKLQADELRAAEEAEELAKSKMSFKQKVVKFFDLDLLKDFTFVNLALGMTIMMFGEMNFSVLTPFILNSYGYTNEQISMSMSLLGGMDIVVRFLAPFALEKVKLDNRVLFAFGIMAIAIGRFIITLTDSYTVVVGTFILIGFGKGFRTIFSPLIIPSYVPLNRLPAASGLQLIFNTIFSIAFGPILGIITDATSYTVTIHFINTLTCLALLLWFGESLVRKMLGKQAVMEMD